MNIVPSTNDSGAVGSPVVPISVRTAMLPFMPLSGDPFAPKVGRVEDVILEINEVPSLQDDRSLDEIASENRVGAKVRLRGIPVYPKRFQHAKMAARLRELRLRATFDAFQVASDVALELAAISFMPNRIACDSERGLVFYFFGGDLLVGGSHELFAAIECAGTGETVVHWEDRRREVIAVGEIDQGEWSTSFSTLRAFIRGR